MTKIYLGKLDAVRGIAILLVLWYHTLSVIFPGYEVKTYSANGLFNVNDGRSLLLNFNPLAQGWMGVELFLAVSGFLIHFIYLQNQESFGWRSFFNKRFWRIYPPYLLVLLFFYVNQLDLSKGGITDLLAHVFLVHNLSNRTFFGINPSFWTIALEAQLYSLYPLYLFLRKRLGAPKTTVLVILLSIGWAVAGAVLNKHSLVYEAFVARIWAVWCLGAFLAERYYAGKRLFNRPARWLLLFYVLIYVFKVFSVTRYLVPIAATLSCVALIEACLYSASILKYLDNRQPVGKFLSFTGLISYSIYLIHQPFLPNLINFFSLHTRYVHLNLLAGVLSAYLIIFLVAYALYQLLELRSIRHGKRYEQ